MFLTQDIDRAFASVAAGQTDSVVVTATAGFRIVVLAAVAQAGGTATVITFNTKGSGAGVAISPAFPNGATGTPIVLPPNDDGWFQTDPGEALTVTTGAGSTTVVHVVYALLAGLANLQTDAGESLRADDGTVLTQEI